MCEIQIQGTLEIHVLKKIRCHMSDSINISANISEKLSNRLNKVSRALEDYEEDRAEAKKLAEGFIGGL